jgi:hypothetical protein
MPVVVTPSPSHSVLRRGRSLKKKNRDSWMTSWKSLHAIYILEMLARPALVLYRRILRVHRSRLPDSMRQLGDSYVRCVRPRAHLFFLLARALSLHPPPAPPPAQRGVQEAQEGGREIPGPVFPRVDVVRRAAREAERRGGSHRLVARLCARELALGRAAGAAQQTPRRSGEGVVALNGLQIRLNRMPTATTRGLCTSLERVARSSCCIFARDAARGAVRLA